MAIVLMEGFDKWSSFADWYANSGASSTLTSLSTNGGRWGNKALNVSAYVNMWLPSAYSTVIWGFAWKAVSSSDPMYISLQDTTTVQCVLRFTGGIPYFQRGSTTIATGTQVITTSAWNYYEIKLTVHPSAGSFEVRVNGVVQMSGSGVNTRVTANNQVNQYGFSHYGGGGNHNFCDMYLCDTSGSANTDFLGDTRVEYLVPTGAGVRSQFTPSAGSNWQTVDDVAGDTDYNSNNQPGAMDLFTMADLAGSGLVRGVQAISRAKKDDAGFRKASPVFYKASGLGGTARFYKGSQVPVLDSFSNLPLQMFNTSPDTGVAWTVDEVNALQCGYAVGDAGMFTLDAKVV